MMITTRRKVAPVSQGWLPRYSTNRSIVAHPVTSQVRPVAKGAHYRAFPRRTAGAARLETGGAFLKPASGLWSLALAALLLLGASPVGAQKDARSTEAELKALKAEIERVRRQVSRDQVQRDRIARGRREAGMSASAVRESLEGLRKQRAEVAARREALAKEQSQQQAQPARQRESLARQLRAAYLIGREEPLKLLLNQKDPARAGRMFAYYGYFGRARAQQIDRITETLQRLEELATQVAAEDAKLAELEAKRVAELEALETARAKRGKALAALQAVSRTRERTLERLKREQAGLEKLLRELRRAMEKAPKIDGRDAFAKLRGKLSWPVKGRLVARFGEPRAGGLKWDGVLLATERGATVRA